MKHHSYKFTINTFIIFILLGQIVFLMFSSSFTKPRYEGRIFATIGAQHDGESNLHELNEAAHFFGQTMIGWTKFPSFEKSIEEAAGLAEVAQFNGHLQERQNIVFTLFNLEPVTQEQLMKAQEFVLAEINEYNQSSNTQFVLTNFDYDLNDASRTYLKGAIFSFLVSGVLALAVLFVRREFFDSK